MRVEKDPEAECPVPLDDLKSVVDGSEEDEKLQVKIQAFEEKINVDNSTPGSVRRYSLGQVSKEERKDMRFNRFNLTVKDYQHKSNNALIVPRASDSVPSWFSPACEAGVDTVQSCVAKLFFSCPLKGHYCLYSKSSFTLVSQQPPLWIHIMFLFQQSLFEEPLSTQSSSVQVLKALWEKSQLKGMHSFETAMIQSTFPQQKDLEKVQMHLEEVRFFDLFGYSEETGAWQCFMCNNPEKATGVNQDGQPLMEGKLKEKQVRWKFIKRWKTRYFTLAGNQLLFRRGKSKDDPDESPIELSKVQSVKVVARKRRERGLPRAFEIFTDSRSYVLKARDERNAEEWLQCLNVALFKISANLENSQFV
ncbi:ventricular zone-expressed PH domain-containing protein 1 [Turdus rufiventris]|nr:ventricular zone-expressed PH domain-containing protein 1 [Turdus rufiventris]